jgi:hypothetical protein
VSSVNFTKVYILSKTCALTCHSSDPDSHAPALCHTLSSNAPFNNSKSFHTLVPPSRLALHNPPLLKEILTYFPLHPVHFCLTLVNPITYIHHLSHPQPQKQPTDTLPKPTDGGELEKKVMAVGCIIPPVPSFFSSPEQ